MAPWEPIRIEPLFNDPLEIFWYQNQANKLLTNTANVGEGYRFKLTNLATTCWVDTVVHLPSYPRINASFITSSPSGGCLNSLKPEIDIIDYSVGGIRGTWSWGDGSNITYDNTTNPSHRYTSGGGTYTIKLNIENNAGCADSSEAQVCVYDTTYCFIPTAFSPQNDGLNDEYKVTCTTLEEYEMIIFDRWGEIVFRSNDVNEAWDGNMLGQPLMKGVYGYQLTYKGVNSVRQTRTGTVVLLNDRQGQ